MPWSATVLWNASDHRRPGHRPVASHRDGVAGMVVDEAQISPSAPGCGVGSGQLVVGEVGLPHLVGLLGANRTKEAFGFFAGSGVINPARFRMRQIVAGATVN